MFKEYSIIRAFLRDQRLSLIKFLKGQDFCVDKGLSYVHVLFVLAKKGEKTMTNYRAAADFLAVSVMFVAGYMWLLAA